MAQETQQATGTQGGTGEWQAPDVIPTFSYEDAPAAIEFLERAFGFERHAVYEGEGGKIDHAQLRFGSGMIMLGSAVRQREEWPSKSPGEVGASTGGTYVTVEDPDAHCERAKAAGAEIITEPTDKDYGSRDYSVRDPEGYLWNFGTYRPTGEGEAAG
jgi:uncharacterized glyoxalase superfamily protein PhnB